MTNFIRKFLDEFAKNNKTTDLTVFGSTATGSSVTSSDPEVLQSNSKFYEGWKGATLENLTNNTRNPVANEWSALDYIHNYHINHIYNHKALMRLLSLLFLDILPSFIKMTMVNMFLSFPSGTLPAIDHHLHMRK